MAKYRGSALIAVWIWPGGTLILQGAYESLETNFEIELLDVSSGSDTDREYIPGLRKGGITYKTFDDTAGTATVVAFREGTFGTLLWGPQGTVAGLPKYGCAAFVRSAKTPLPFDKPAELEIALEKHLAILFTPPSVWP